MKPPPCSMALSLGCCSDYFGRPRGFAVVWASPFHFQPSAQKAVVNSSISHFVLLNFVLFTENACFSDSVIEFEYGYRRERFNDGDKLFGECCVVSNLEVASIQDREWGWRRLFFDCFQQSSSVQYINRPISLLNKCSKEMALLRSYFCRYIWNCWTLLKSPPLHCRQPEVVNTAISASSPMDMKRVANNRIFNYKLL